MLRYYRSRSLRPRAIRQRYEKKLRALVRHCYDHVPLYRSRFEASGVHPWHIRTIDDLEKIPLLDKGDVRHAPIEYVTADNVDLTRCWVFKTSGTSGIPLTTYWIMTAKVEGSYIRHYVHQIQCGDRIRTRRVSIASHTPSLPTFLQRFGVFPTREISPFENVRRQLEEIQMFHPNTLLSSPSCTLHLAKELNDLPLKGIDVSLIFTGGEFLNTFTRRYVEDAFNADVFDSYGATEVGGIATECREHRFHVEHHSALVEITQDGKAVSPGEEGEITVTNLLNEAQPFLRYNLEDLGRLVEEDCPCGNHAPILEITRGRKSDVVHRPDGSSLSANEVTMFLTYVEGIKQFQVVQETTDSLTVRFVRGRRFTPGLIDEIKRIFLQRLGEAMEVRVEDVNRIPREKSGKFAIFKTFC